MNKYVVSLIVTVGLCIVTNTMAQESLVDNVIKACETDIKTYCSQVTPGHGRMLHCMAAHEDKISGSCEYALYRAATILEQLTAAIAYVASECAADIRTYCSDVAMGEGRILNCLEEHEDAVSDACNAAVDETVGE